ncbi:MAG: hypothetical protein ABI288_07045 [Ginsengibacter sp.]
MGKRKVTILEPAAISVVEAGWFIESLGLEATAIKFVNEVFDFLKKYWAICLITSHVCIKTGNH